MSSTFCQLTPSTPLKYSNNIVVLQTTLLSPACGGTEKAAKWSITKDLTSVESAHSNFNVDLSVAYEKQITETRRVICPVEDPLQKMMLVDAIQRLGIDYHFQMEIESFLEGQFKEIMLKKHAYKSLYEVSLCFRLLRQAGHYVSTEIFNDFKDKDGRFNKILRQDIKGLMELYEATQLNLLEDKDILHEAANFSRKHLNESLEYLDLNQARKVQNSLKHPYHKSLSKFMAKGYLKDFEGIYEWIKPLQVLTRMEITMTQRIHCKELSQISEWWKDLKLSLNLKLARDQPLKWYTVTMASLTDIGLSEQRIELTKAISFIYIIDDIYDIYGTLDQLTLFTEAIKRWESAEIEELPDYMKKCFKALRQLTNDIGYKIFTKYGHNPVYFLRKTWESLCDAFLVEAKWFASKEPLKPDEYLKVARKSSGIHVVTTHLFFLFGLGATKECGLCLNDISILTSSIATILRLYDDLGSAKDENQYGNDGSYIDYYVQEHGVTVEFARQHVFNMISNEWVQLNKETHCLRKYAPSSFIKASLNLARMVPLMYNYDDNQCLPLLEAYVNSVFSDD